MRINEIKSLSIARNLEIGDKVLLFWTHEWHDVLDICECYERSYDLVSCNNCPGRIYFSDHEDDDLCRGDDLCYGCLSYFPFLDVIKGNTFDLSSFEDLLDIVK